MHFDSNLFNVKVDKPLNIISNLSEDRLKRVTLVSNSKDWLKYLFIILFIVFSRVLTYIEEEINAFFVLQLIWIMKFKNQKTR